MMLSEAVQKALALFEGKPNADVGEIRDDLMAVGIDAELATNLVCFIPVALCRLVFGAVGVQFAPDYIAIDDAGNEIGRATFEDDPVYVEAYTCCTSVLASGKQAEPYRPIAARSPDYKAIMELHLQQGVALKGLSLPAPRLNLPLNLASERGSAPPSEQMPAEAKRYMDIVQAHSQHPFVKQFFYEVTLLEWNVPDKGVTSFWAMQFRDGANGALVWTDSAGTWRIGRWIGFTGKEIPLPVDVGYFKDCQSATTFEAALLMLEASQREQGAAKQPWYTRLWKRS